MKNQTTYKLYCCFNDKITKIKYFNNFNKLQQFVDIAKTDWKSAEVSKLLPASKVFKDTVIKSLHLIGYARKNSGRFEKFNLAKKLK